MRTRTIAASFAIAACALLASPDDAAACSCAPAVFATSPAAGATNVPLNAVVIASYDTSADVTLKAVGGANVPLTVERFGSGATGGRWLVGTPATALAASTQYELTITGFETLTTRFTTGDAVDTTPAPTALTGFRPEVMRYPTPDGCINTCIESAGNGLITRMHVDLPAPPSDAALVALEILAADGTTVIDELALREPGAQTIDWALCDLQAPALEANTMYCARAITLDVAGNRAVTEAICTSTTTCQSVKDPELTCTPSRECLPVDDGSGGTGNDDDDDDGDNGGCSTSGGPLGLSLGLGLATLAFNRRRRR